MELSRADFWLSGEYYGAILFLRAGLIPYLDPVKSGG